MVVDFWATWCGPCKKIGPDIEALAEEYKEQAVIGKCDVEENDGLAMRFGVRNVPTVIFIKTVRWWTNKSVRLRRVLSRKS